MKEGVNELGSRYLGVGRWKGEGGRSYPRAPVIKAGQQIVM